MQAQRSSGWRYMLFVFGLVILATLIMDFNSRMSDLNRLKAERELVSAKVTMQVQTQAALEGQIAYATSDAAALEWAYEEVHMARPGDQVVVPIQVDASTPTPTPRPTPVPTEVNHPQEWWNFFFGEGSGY